MGGFGLPLRDSEDAGAHDLGDEGRRVDHEAEQQRHEFRQDLHAAAQVEALLLGHVEGDGAAAEQRQRQPDERRHAKDQCQGRQSDGILAARALLLALGPDAEGDAGGDAEHEYQADEPGLLGEDGARHEQAAVVEEEIVADIDRLARVRQRREDGVVPEQELQQQRQVADHLHIDHRNLADDPVLGQARDADDEAEDGGEDDADGGDDQRVEKADHEGFAVGRGGGAEWDEGLADVEAGRVVEEAETGGDAGPLQVVDGVGRRLVEQEANHRDKDDLGDDSSDARVVERRHPGGLRRCLSDCRHRDPPPPLP